MAIELLELHIDKLVHGGQGLGVLPDGRKCFIWGVLPTEVARVRITKSKKDWAEGYADEIVKPSKDRIKPLEPKQYIATSPWQIISYQAEAKFKQQILEETFVREGIVTAWKPFQQSAKEFGYRNKMEYCFWWDNEENKIHLALHQRGKHHKIIVEKSELASSFINDAGKQLIDFLNLKHIQARSLKSVIIRSTSSGDIGVSLFVVDKTISSKLTSLNKLFKCFEVIYSNPKSPASVVTKIIIGNNNHLLTDDVLGKKFSYQTRSFFQANISIYTTAIKEIKKYIDNEKLHNILDLYSGVGSIGLNVASNKQHLLMVETDNQACSEAKLNASIINKNSKVINALAEKSLSYLYGQDAIIVDPPRAGLNKKVVQSITGAEPEIFVYLSCNPSTQARDISYFLDNKYSIVYARGFNFFPRTPHIESLIVLEKQ